ncbi:unnamed protein product [Schistosoma curassoni]|uniref:Uncharacterized protein n=1 Tax=Schistosoma curassoni TaxID=6186 RepID=A0A183KTK3_9TREM|nr:unnamed protein product [Schistosoma curassoni]
MYAFVLFYFKYNSSLIIHEYEESCHQIDLRDSLATITQSFADEITPRCTTPNDKFTSSNKDTFKELSTDKSNDETNVKKIFINRQEGQGIFQSRPKLLRTPDSSPPENKKFTKYNNNTTYMNDVHVDDDDNDDDDDDDNSSTNRRKARQSPDSTVSSSTHNKSIIDNNLLFNNTEIDLQYSDNKNKQKCKFFFFNIL